MNRLYLLIPALGEKDAGQDIAYLKVLGEIDNEDVISILRRIVQSMGLVDGEDVELLYDAQHLNCLMSKGKLKTTQQEMPHLEDLLLFFTDAASIQQKRIGRNPMTINGIHVDKGLVNAFVSSGEVGDTLLNKEALATPHHPIEVEDDEGKRHSLNVLPCTAADVYLWLIENRTPQRKLDPNYKKHGSKERVGKKGVRISPLTYTEQQLNDFLKRAVVAKKGLRELYFKDKENDKIIIFWNENLEAPTYHALEIAANDAAETQKIFKRGGQALANRIEKTAELV